MTNVKQVILIRKDLHMRRGKEIAQGSHASMEFLVAQLRAQLLSDPAAEVKVVIDPAAAHWITKGIAKICLRVESEADLLRYHEAALAKGLPSHVIRDSGRTEFHGVPTYTACAIGPGEAEAIDAITGELVLY
ncbi:MAG: aminoacyl-tRNA hydrolase [Proteobacteria bacterium]|nr:MAG: aminoacyl-tRNA hydrolase [Pseudomonadota bacterium]